MSKVVITIESDGSQWLPYQTSGPNEGLPPGYHRAGTFSIPHELIEEGDPSVFAVMSQVVVVRCEHEWQRAKFIYHAFSPHFRPVATSEIVPEYLIIFHKDENRRIDSFEFKEPQPLSICPACGGRGGFHKEDNLNPCPLNILS